jgi:hypothetical protein
MIQSEIIALQSRTLQAIFDGRHGRRGALGLRQGAVAAAGCTPSGSALVRRGKPDAADAARRT